MPQTFSIACKRVTMTAAAVVVGLGAINIAAPAVSFAFTQSPAISGRLYFWRGLDMRPLNGAVSGASAPKTNQRYLKFPDQLIWAS
jgi:hypothetical protein